MADHASQPTVLHVITGLNQGGAENVLARLVRCEKRHRHVVVSLHWEGPLGRSLRDAGTEVHFLGFERGSFHLRGLVRLWRLIRRTRPQVLQTWMYHPNLIAGILGKAAGVPRIIWNIRRTSLGRERTSRSTRIIAKLGALLSNRVPDRIVCCAAAAAESHIAFGYDPARICVIPNGIDTTLFRPDPATRARMRRMWSVDEREPLIGYVARLHPDKDHRTLFAALALLRQRGVRLKCLLVGSGTGPDDDALRQLASGAGIADQLIGLGERDDLPAVMAALDLHVSSSATEGFPNVIAEAMAAGVPCVATNVGDTRAIIGSSGWVVPPRSPEALATAVQEALAKSGTAGWPALQEQARQRIEREFGIDAMVDSYTRLWSGVANGRPLPACQPVTSEASR